jgi:hypothetical protein
VIDSKECVSGREKLLESGVKKKSGKPELPHSARNSQLPDSLYSKKVMGRQGNSSYL